jgi:alcohol dehydrogenase
VCENQQQPGFTHWGSFAELVVVDAADVNVVQLPDALGFDTAAGLGCRFATAYRAVVHHARPGPGSWLAVHGCGGVGLSAVMIAVAAGARVIAVDPTPVARERAAALGAEVVLEPGGSAAAIRDLTGGGTAASIDAIGGPDTLSRAVAGLATRGRHVQVGLVAPAPTVPAGVISMAIARELEILGSHGMPAHDYPAMLDRISSGELDPGRLIRRHIDLDEAATALPAVGTAEVDGVTIVHPTRARPG